MLITIGQYANLRMRKRISSLKQLIILVEGINSQISYSRRNISEIIEDLSFGEGTKLKTICELINNKSIDFSENWRNSFMEYSSNDCLNEDDKKILLSFGKVLGVTDLQGQNSNCLLHKTMLEKQLKNAEDKLKEKSQINTALSSFLALASVIIFY